MNVMYGVHEQFVEQARGFCPTAPILVKEFDPFQTAPVGTPESGMGFFFFFFVFFSFYFNISQNLYLGCNDK